MNQIDPSLTQTDAKPAFDIAADVSTLNRDGIIGKKGAFSRDWAEAMREDMMTAFWKAISSAASSTNSCRSPSSTT